MQKPEVTYDCTPRTSSTPAASRCYNCGCEIVSLSGACYSCSDTGLTQPAAPPLVTAEQARPTEEQRKQIAESAEKFMAAHSLVFEDEPTSVVDLLTDFASSLLAQQQARLDDLKKRCRYDIPAFGDYQAQEAYHGKAMHIVLSADEERWAYHPKTAVFEAARNVLPTAEEAGALSRYLDCVTGGLRPEMKREDVYEFLRTMPTGMMRGWAASIAAEARLREAEQRVKELEAGDVVRVRDLTKWIERAEKAEADAADLRGLLREAGEALSLMPGATFLTEVVNLCQRIQQALAK